MLVSQTLKRLLILLVLGLALCASAQAGPLSLFKLAGTSSQQSQQDNKKADQPDSKQLQKSLDDIIDTLENDDERQALLKQLKSLRTATREAGHAEKDETSGLTSNGILDALASSITDLGEKAESDQGLAAIWHRRADAAMADVHTLMTSSSRTEWLKNIAASLLALLVWIGLLVAQIKLGHHLFRRQGWQLALPRQPGPWRLVAHFWRAVLPWMITFVILLFATQWLSVPTVPSVVVLVCAYVTLCARVLTAVVEIIIALFTSGHRRVAVEIIRDNALRSLFVIGALVAFSDAIVSGQMPHLLGTHLASWLSVSAGIVAGLLSAWLILRFRRPVTHLMANRPYIRRRAQSALYNTIRFLARLWYVPALFLIGTPLFATIFTGGEANAALPRAILCAVLLIITLVLTGVLREESEHFAQKQRRHEYRIRLGRFGFTLAHYLSWIVFVELALRVWGLSLLHLGERSQIAALITKALLEVGFTILVAWLAWVLIDTAILRALNSRRTPGRPRADMRARTMTPMIRNVTLFIILIIAVLVVLSNLGVNTTPLLAGAGIVGLAFGFGAQTLVQDLISGIFILIEDSLAVGDFVKIREHMGTVEGLNLRTVRLRDLDGILHIINFSYINMIHNMSREFGTALLKIRIPWDLPIDDAIQLMKDTAEDLRKEPIIRFKVWSPIEIQGIHSFEDGCAILRMRMRTAPEYQWDVGRAFNLLLKRRMEEQQLTFGAPRLSVSMESGGGEVFDKQGKHDGNEPIYEGRTGPTPDPG